MSLAQEILKGARRIADYTGFSEREVRDYARNGELPTFRVGKHLCARKSEIDKRCSGGSAD